MFFEFELYQFHMYSILIFRTYIHINRLIFICIHFFIFSVLFYENLLFKLYNIKTNHLSFKFFFKWSLVWILKFILLGEMNLCNKAKKYMLICRLIHQATNMESTLNKFHHLNLLNVPVFFLSFNLLTELKSWSRKFATNYNMKFSYHGIII